MQCWFVAAWRMEILRFEKELNSEQQHHTNAVKDEDSSLESSGSVETRISTAMLEFRELLNGRDSEPGEWDYGRPEKLRTIKKTSQEENGKLKEALCFLEAEGYAYKEFHCMHSPLAVVSTCPFSFWRQFHHNFLIFIFPRLFFCPQRVGNVRKLLVAWEREEAP